MGRVTDFVDPEYDRKLQEFKARKARMRQEAGQSDSREQEKRN